MAKSGVNHPLLNVAPGKLRPTQASVGKAEVTAKRKEWQRLDKKKRKQLLASHWFPGVLGPKGKVYIVDHHHLGLALLEERVKTVPVLIQRDFSWLEPAMFWRTMEFNRWAHPYDRRGVRVAYDEIPVALTDLQDDPYRTLAARVRVAGGCAKDVEPYAEFLWADFYRRLIPLHTTAPTPKQMGQAISLAREANAAYLPGWSGPIA